MTDDMLCFPVLLDISRQIPFFFFLKLVSELLYLLCSSTDNYRKF